MEVETVEPVVDEGEFWETIVEGISNDIIVAICLADSRISEKLDKVLNEEIEEFTETNYDTKRKNPPGIIIRHQFNKFLRAKYLSVGKE